LILKKGERYRTISSHQRYGVDLEECSLHFDPQRRLITLGGSKEQEEIHRIGQAILDVLAAQEEDQENGRPLTEPEIVAEVEGKTTHLRSALRDLITREKVERRGKGGKGDPFRYALKDSRFLVPPISREHGNKNPQMTVNHQNDCENSCSSDLASSACGDQSPETSILAYLRTNPESEGRSAASDSADSCSLVPTLYRERQEQASNPGGSLRLVNENSCSQGLASTRLMGTRNVSAPQDERESSQVYTERDSQAAISIGSEEEIVEWTA
jgi:hypothetical protein